MAHKIINDPVHGFISLDNQLILDITDHPWMQRLRRIRQLGMTNLVYPGAQHTRYQHALGAMHLMHMAIDTLRSKGNAISDAEAISAKAAILLHDIGHGPFSHVLENTIVNGISHEEISKTLMERMNDHLGGRLTQAIEIFEGKGRKFLHQLISSQLDTDRLDYLKRDSFFSGVVEGDVSSDRIIKMLNICDDKLVVDAKGIYSIENFLIARRLMYWQVYLHKTVIAAEKMLIQILARAKQLASNGVNMFAPPPLAYFLYNDISGTDFNNDETIANFTQLDDTDIMSAIKIWASHPDRTLSILSSAFINRRLFRIEIHNTPIAPETVEQHKQQVAQWLGCTADECSPFVISGQVSNQTYAHDNDQINIRLADSTITDIAQASDMLKIDVLKTTDSRYFICYPKSPAHLRP